ncbi:MAG: PKD domain-containing protein [Thermoplasmatota archaeon]
MRPQVASVLAPLAALLILLPSLGPLIPRSEVPNAQPPHELPWFLDDIRPPLNPPPGFMMPEAHVHGDPDSYEWPDYAGMTVTDEQLEGPAEARTVYPLLQNFSLSLSFEYDATVAQFADMANGLRRFADLVYDYTDGQFYINRFDLYNNQMMWDSTNIHVRDIGMYRANAHLGGYYYGGIIQIGRDAWGQPWDSAMGAVILGHEMGHYAFMLPDEYIEHPGYDESLCNNASADTSIMSDPYQFHELCTNESHNRTSTGDPLSCWAYIKQYYPAVVEVHGKPDPGPTVGPGAMVVWHYPDLWVSSGEMSVYPSGANEGDELSVVLPVHNPERLVSTTATVKFYLDSVSSESLIHTATVNVAGSESTTVSFKWRAVGGSHDVIGVADPDGALRELSETNNTATKSIVVNSRPRISPSLAGFISDEDTPIVARMTTFASDAEDPASTLRWSVARYDSRHLASVSSGPNQTLVFTPLPNWSGATPVTVSVADSRGLSAQREINLTFRSVNDPPTTLEPAISRPSVLRGQSVELSAGGRDVENGEEELSPVFEWRAPGTSEWLPLEAVYDGSRFKAALVVPLSCALGRADARLAFVDLEGCQGEWSYLNSSLEILNNRPSTVDIHVSDEALLRGSQLVLTLNASDAEAQERELRPSLQCSCAGGEWMPLEAPWEFLEGVWSAALDVNASWPIGVYDFRARVTDPDGGESAWLELSSALRVDNSPPSVERESLSRSRLLRGGSALVTVAADDFETASPNLTLELVLRDSKGRTHPNFIAAINFKDGQWVVELAPPLSAPAGRYTLELRVGDDDGGWSEWRSSLGFELLNNAPVASFSAPPTIRQGELAWFDASNSSDAEGELSSLSILWSFGDGTGGASGPRVSHVFERSGRFRVTLTVTDRDGETATAEAVVTVEPRPEEPSPITSGSAGVALLAGAAVAVALGAAAGLLLLRKVRKGRAGSGGASGGGARGR